jgi:hypothetical protein
LGNKISPLIRAWGVVYIQLLLFLQNNIRLAAKELK